MDFKKELPSIMFSSIVLTTVGALLKILHYQYAYLLIIIGLVLTAIFVITAIIEVTNSKNIDKSEKLMWIVGFLFFGIITGLIYILSARKRIIRNRILN